LTTPEPGEGVQSWRRRKGCRSPVSVGAYLIRTRAFSLSAHSCRCCCDRLRNGDRWNRGTWRETGMEGAASMSKKPVNGARLLLRTSEGSSSSNAAQGGRFILFVGQQISKGRQDCNPRAWRCFYTERVCLCAISRCLQWITVSALRRCQTAGGGTVLAHGCRCLHPSFSASRCSAISVAVPINLAVNAMKRRT
jgi:hypothetical protein